jgi:hypothetical protein
MDPAPGRTAAPSSESDTLPGPAYEAAAVRALLDEPRHPHAHREVPHARQVFVNRNLRMDKIEAVGFDMDYTLAIYHLVRLETLAFRMTLRPGVRHPRRRHRQAVRQHLQDGPAQPRRTLLPRAPAAAGRRAPPAVP